jgi:methyl-accepting chemotaxis protein-1 (serine sensor receptor)
MLNKGITIKARIGLVMAFLAALLLIIGVLGLTGMSRSNDAYHETFTNAMPSAVDIGNAEIYAARERLALDRAAFLFGTPDVAATVDRARLLRTTSDGWWKKYYDLPRGAEEDRLAEDVSAKRETLHQAMDGFAAIVGRACREGPASQIQRAIVRRRRLAQLPVHSRAGRLRCRAE